MESIVAIFFFSLAIVGGIELWVYVIHTHLPEFVKSIQKAGFPGKILGACPRCMCFWVSVAAAVGVTQSGIAHPYFAAFMPFFSNFMLTLISKKQ